jgi:3,4-dihydroxy 2-butanone 4-phosphate synthase/GTP cyclohydrolase II
MVSKNSDSFKTGFTVTVDHISTKTGISAFERAETLKQLINPNSKPAEFNKPGHIFPLQIQHGGVLTRPGHTEASADLAKLAGLHPSGTICEIVNPDGTMARLPQIMEYAKEWGMNVVSVQDLINYIKSNNIKLYADRKYDARLLAQSKLPTAFGEFELYAFDNFGSEEPNLALVKGDPSKFRCNPLIRVHSECFTGDLLASSKCDCGAQLHEAMRKIQEEGEGMIIYLRQEGRGIGLVNKIRAYKLQEDGYDTVEANHKLGFASDLRDFKAAADIMKYFGINDIRILTNNPLKMKDLEKHGIRIKKRENIEIPAHCGTINYLKTKKEKMNHILEKV